MTAEATIHRVVFVVGSLEPGGAERQLIGLVNHLDRSRFRPAIVTWAGAGRLARELAPDVRRIDLDLVADTHSRLHVRARTSARLLAALVRTFRELRPDVVHGYLFQSYAIGALAARATGVPFVVSGRRNLSTYHDLPLPARAVGRLANALTDLHVANSEAAREAVVRRERVDPARVVVVPNGVDAPDPEVPMPVGADDWFRPGVPTAAVLAGLKPVKGHDRLLDVLARVPGEVPLRVICLGGGPLQAHLEARIEQLGLGDRVRLVGAHTSARHWLPRFDFLVHTALRESSPNAVLEAMAAGLPVAAFAVGGISELVEDGVSGLLGTSVEEVARHVTRLAADPELRARLGAAARLRSHGQSVAAMVSSTEAWYATLLGLPAASVALREQAVREQLVDQLPA